MIQDNLSPLPSRALNTLSQVRELCIFKRAGCSKGGNQVQCKDLRGGNYVLCPTPFTVLSKKALQSAMTLIHTPKYWPKCSLSSILRGRLLTPNLRN